MFTEIDSPHVLVDVTGLLADCLLTDSLFAARSCGAVKPRIQLMGTVFLIISLNQ
jgi:hypothetical protein